MYAELEKGFHILHDFIDHGEIAQINESIPLINECESRGGVRRIERKNSLIRELIFSEKMQSIANKFLKSDACFVRAILFNKTLKNNWMVAWHQDRTVAVSEQFTLESWGPWSIKDGTIHVQPPQEVLENMVTIRLHLDDTNKENGCLKVIPNSHLNGILSHDEIQHKINEGNYVNCEAKAGSLLIMRPHILHASSKIQEPTQRRILHIEYCCFELPQGISWV